MSSTNDILPVNLALPDDYEELKKLCLTIHQRITDAITNDTDFECSCMQMLRTYQECDDRDRRIINGVLIDVCGWSLPTLVKGVNAFGNLIH
jgi:hypothetical protein